MLPVVSVCCQGLYFKIKCKNLKPKNTLHGWEMILSIGWILVFILHGFVLSNLLLLYDSNEVFNQSQKVPSKIMLEMRRVYWYVMRNLMQKYVFSLWHHLHVLESFSVPLRYAGGMHLSTNHKQANLAKVPYHIFPLKWHRHFCPFVKFYVIS